MSEALSKVHDAICGVVLAGGKSRRMGANKPLLLFKDKPLIAHVIDALAPHFAQIVIVTDALSVSKKDYAHFPCRVLCEQIEGLGPIGGIEAALKALPGKDLFVVGADMPFLKGTVIEAMLRHVKGHDFVVPRLEGRLHPLHAFYGANCLPAVTAAIRSKRLALHRLSAPLNTYFFPEKVFRALDPNLRSIFNINTPEALIEANTLYEDASRCP